MFYSKGSVITVGTFDGVHVGHQKILSKLMQRAREHHLKAVVLTLFPHPRMVLNKDSDLKLLLTIEERKNQLKKLGIDEVVIMPFTKTFSNLSPLEYVENILLNELNTKYIIIGYDHRFGKNRSANILDLKQFGEQFGFEVEEISALEVESVAVSSTKIRKALANGDIETANTYLGYPYFLTGKVVKGRGIGRTIDFPTANISIDESYKLIPKNGVYVVKSAINNREVFGMMNIGTKPTVDGTQQSIEVHWFGVNENLYDIVIKIELLERLRDEHKFESLDALKNQLKTDQKNALHYIKQHV
ncbi:bifunctional riboflavin kinase/FAD synthetase [Paucihalobacter ruber]|uniref:Riboflavin biosynthesis protein n=1 Tax=Paucihalobacter ruber TaxID=2567861 RepID=A0A506PPE3_9FLAO|nr:bifunctional riboflavin kinase/FAD synthetase [Paucihalobacter ruber]TPV35095.1 bifunctional riboflavin kinase/FAD synthetase [Paucihalobacter ruber]